MENLDDRYDPDRWMASGKDLGNFLSSGPEAEQYYAAHPKLGQRVARWRTIVSDESLKARKERNEWVSEQRLRKLWRSIRRAKSVLDL
jgi:hypothetical protein